MSQPAFCTCTDLACPMHPANHDKGCTPCIAKNIREREIPSCFFNMLTPGEKHPEYSFEEFARTVMAHPADKSQE